MQVVRAIAKVTFLEIMREKVLYNILVVATLLFGIGLLASRFTFIQPERVVLDFGLSAVKISSGLLAVLIGAGLLGKELERRTLLVALSRPISHFHFVFGKYCGLVSILVLNWALLTLIYCLLLLGQGDAFTLGRLSFTFWSALIAALLQSLVLGGLAVFFSSFSTASLAVILTFGLYLVGVNCSELRMTAARLHSPIGKWILNGISTVLPNFEHFNLGFKLTYDLPISFQFISFGVLYSLAIVLFCMLGSGILLRTKT